jgi:hypothetical protein
MNPLNLLTKGHTIKGFKNRSGAYKLTTVGTVPSFSPPKPAPPTTTHPAAEVSQSTLFDKPKPIAAPPLPKPQVVVPPAIPRETAWNRLTALCRKLLDQWTVRAKASPFQRRTVQTELALDRVTVIRNDLSEDGLEVVPVGKKGKRAPKQEREQEHEQCQATSTNR